MSNTMRLLLDNIETNNVMNILSDPSQRQAPTLRMNFIKKYIIKKNTNSYTNKVERDYAYTVLREYRYLVNLNQFVFTLGFASLIPVFGRKFQKRQLAIYFLITCFVSKYSQKYYLLKHNKRLFDMCNVGEETELGYQRNLVLKECNKILDTEDF